MNNLNKIAKKIFLSYLRTNDDLINKQIYYLRKLFNKEFNKFFDGDKLKQDIVQQQVKIDLREILSTFEGQSIIKVNVIMFYVDKIDKKDYINGVMRTQYQAGQGQSLVYNGKNYIVMYGDTEASFVNKRWFLNTFIHELMHTINHQFDEDYSDSQNINFYYGHPIEQPTDDNNAGIPYPGMYGDDDDSFDERFAEYYTCRAERKEYIHSLIGEIINYVNKHKMKKQQVMKFIKKLRNHLENDTKEKFKEFIYTLADNGFSDYNSLIFLYHLAFSKQQNGNKQDAIKILSSLRCY